MGFFALIPGKTWATLAAVAAIAGLVWAGYHAIDGRGYSRCEREHAVALSHAQEEAHQTYLAEVARGDQLSADLAKTQRRLDDTKREYLTYANSITGVCDPSFRVFVEHASGAKTGVPAATGAPTSATAAEAAADLAYQTAITRAIGANVAENYARLDKCVAEFGALIDWYQRPEEAVK